MPDRRSILALAGGLAILPVGIGAALAKPVTEQAMGAVDAPVTMIEYASLTCPHCAHFQKAIMPDVLSRYVNPGKVRYIYRDFPLDGIALRAAVVAHCAGPERYFRFVDALFATQESWAYAKDPIGALKQTARIGGLPEADIDACLADKSMEDAVLASRLQAQKEFKVAATPTFIINGKVVSGVQSIDDLAALIDPLLK